MSTKTKSEKDKSETIFSKIIKKEIPAEILYEDEMCLAFEDVAPQAPVHALVIPKVFIENLADAQTYHEQLLGHLMIVANKVAELKKLKGYRVVINNGKRAGQTVFHLHLHVIGGRALSWPPG